MSVFADIPAFPMSFYGSVTINGTVAPIGTIVRAYYGTAPAGQAVVNEAGIYGYNSPTKQQLLVGEGSGGAIRFTFQANSLNGGQETEGTTAQTHLAFVPGGVIEKNLIFTYTVPVVTPPSSNSGGGGGGGGSSSSTATPSVAPAPIARTAVTTTTPVPVVVANTTVQPVGQVLGAATFIFSKNLTLGSQGFDVTELQKILVAEGFLKVAPTGYFGTMTKVAVIAYQKAHGISPTSGFVGPLTRALLNNGNIPSSQILAPATFVFSKNLTLGSIGNDVTQLQKILVKEGFLKVAPTGYFGAMTKVAVIDYQKIHKIIPVSGYVGPLTRALLNK